MPNLNIARKSGFIVRGGRSVRQMLWFKNIEVSATNAAALAATLMTSLNASALALRPFTVVRTRGTMLVESDQVGASERFSTAYGHIVVTDQAAAAGVASVPTPETDPENDWFVYKRVIQRTAATMNAMLGVLVEFDSKAMRKVDNGSDIVTVSEAGTLSLGSIITVQWRQLIKLH